LRPETEVKAGKNSLTNDYDYLHIYDMAGTIKDIMVFLNDDWNKIKNFSTVPPDCASPPDRASPPDFTSPPEASVSSPTAHHVCDS